MTVLSKPSVKVRKSQGPPEIWPETHAEVARRAARRAPKLELFTAFKLSDDPEARKYIPYDEVVYPKVARKVPEAFRKAELDSLWLAGFLDHANRAKVRSMLSIVGQSSSKESRSAGSTAGSKQVVASSGQAQESLDEDGKPINKKLIPVITDTDMALRMSRRAYRAPADSKQVRTAQKRRSKALRVQPGLKAPELDQYYELSRQEHESAYLIQRVYRRHVVWLRWHLQWQKRLAAIKIQALVRGVVTRRFIALWFLKFLRLVTQWQARIRRHLTQKRLKVRFAREARAATKIQSGVLMFLGKRRARHRRAAMAATAIQRLWRGAVGRAKADRRFLDDRVSAIQRLARKFLASRLYSRRRREMVDAAARIQRAFRGYRSRQIRNTHLQARETEYRRYQSQMLSAEEEVWASKLHIAQKRIKQTRIRERYAEVKRVYDHKLEALDLLEREYMGFRRRKNMMSPREQSAGWDQQFKASIVEFREKVTLAKLELVLDIGLQRRRLEEEIEVKDQQLREMETRARLYAEWRDEENAHLVEDEKRRRFEEEEKRRKQQVAAQRRRWKVRFFTESGKPDKRRAPGRPWDPSALAGPERDTFCGGTVDLLALQHPDSYLKPGSDQSLRQSLEKLYLQCFLNEVQRSETVLQPLFNAVQSAMPAVVTQPEALALLPPTRQTVEAVLSGQQQLLALPAPPSEVEEQESQDSGDPVAANAPSSRRPPAARGGVARTESKKRGAGAVHGQGPELLLEDRGGGRQAALLGPAARVESAAAAGAAGASSEEEGGESALTAGLLTESRLLPAQPHDDEEDGELDDGEEGEGEGALSVAESSSQPSAGSVQRPGPDTEVQELPASPRHLPTGYRSIHPRRIGTDHSVWPLKEAEQRILLTYDQDLLRSRLQKKYAGRTDRRWRSPVTRVPWNLLDELEGERVKWEAEKNKFDRHIRERLLAPLRGRAVRGSAVGAERAKAAAASAATGREGSGGEGDVEGLGTSMPDGDAASTATAEGVAPEGSTAASEEGASTVGASEAEGATVASAGMSSATSGE